MSVLSSARVLRPRGQRVADMEPHTTKEGQQGQQQVACAMPRAPIGGFIVVLSLAYDQRHGSCHDSCPEPHFFSGMPVLN
jgi:hypothetical protein